MPRRPSSSSNANSRSAASSAAAAAAALHAHQSVSGVCGIAPAVPTFTSFAAATAQVLAAGHASPSSSSIASSTLSKSSSISSNISTATSLSTTAAHSHSQTTPWDETALGLLRKCTKRDAVTRARALGDLSTHLKTVTDQQKNNHIGRTFAQAWPDAFIRLVDDDVNAVRVATLTTMRHAVEHLGKRIQPTLVHVIPYWIAATGDLASPVAATAKTSIDVAFPSAEKRKRVASLFVSQLWDHCSRLARGIGRAVGIGKGRKSQGKGKRKGKDKMMIPSNQFDIGDNKADKDSLAKDIAHLLAVVQWIINSAQDDALSLVSSLLDDPLSESDSLPQTHVSSQRIHLFSLVAAALRPSSSSAKAKGKTKHVAPIVTVQQAADLAISIVQLVQKQTDSNSQAQAHRIAQVTDLAIALPPLPAKWDLFLVLLSTFPRLSCTREAIPALSESMSTAALAADPAALHALLPVVATSITGTSSPTSEGDHDNEKDMILDCDLASSLLTPLCHRLFSTGITTNFANQRPNASEGATTSKQSSTDTEQSQSQPQSKANTHIRTDARASAFANAVFPFFVQAVTCVIDALARAHHASGDDNHAMTTTETVLNQWLSQFALPVVRAFVAGLLPPLSSQQTGTGASRRVTFGRSSDTAAPRGKPSNSSTSSSVGFIAALARKLICTHSTGAGQIAQALFDAHLQESEDKEKESNLIYRFDNLLDTIDNRATEQAMGNAVVQYVTQIIATSPPLHTDERQDGDKCQHQAPSSVTQLRIVAAVLAKRAGSLLHVGAVESSELSISPLVVDGLLSLARYVIVSVSSHPDGTTPMESTPLDKQTAIDLATLFSWLVWLSSKDDQHATKVEKALSDLRTTTPHTVTLPVLAQLLSVHERTRTSTHFSPCPALPPAFVDAVVSDALKVCGTDSNASVSVLVAAVRLAELSDGAVEQIVAYLRLQGNDLDGSFDPLFVALLQESQYFSTSLSLSSLLGRTLVSTAFTRAAATTTVPTVMDALAPRLVTDEAVGLIEMLVNDTVRAEEGQQQGDEANEDQSKARGISLGKIITQLGERDAEASTRACACIFERLDSISEACFKLFIRETPFPSIFGRRDVAVAQLVDASNDKRFASEMLAHIPNYLVTLWKGHFNSGDEDEEDNLADDNDDPVCHIMTAVTDSYLTHYLEKPFGLDIAVAVCAVRPLDRLWLHAISNRVDRAVDRVRHPSTASRAATHTLPAVAQLLHGCAHASAGALVPFLSQTVSDLVTIIRRDPGTAIAREAIDVFNVVVTAATTFSTSVDARVRSWLFDEALVVVMRALRRALEMPRGLSKAAVRTLEAYAASVAVQGFAAAALTQTHDHAPTKGNVDVKNDISKEHDDNMRFWRMRTVDALRAFVARAAHEHRGCSVESVPLDACKRIAWMCRLGDKLVAERGDDDVKNASGASATNVVDSNSVTSADGSDATKNTAAAVADVEDMNDELCHWGAWSAVFILPRLQQHSILPSSSPSFVEDRDDHDHDDDGDQDDYVHDDIQYVTPSTASTSNPPVSDVQFDSVDAGGCVSLILKAAERDVLLDGDGSFRVPRDAVYAVLPWLRSSYSQGSNGVVIRRAVLTLVAHAAAVDLPEWISRNFPHGKGFPDEATEEAFATGVFPEPLRTALKWDSVCERHISHEIGFFLAWRLLLDMLHVDGDVEGARKRTTKASSSSGTRAKDGGVSLGRRAVSWFTSGVGAGGSSSSSAKREDEEDGDGEDVSLRRMAVTWFKTDDGSALFQHFIKRCVNVVVDGSQLERRAAAQAAQNALQVDAEQGHPIQGIQLVIQQQQKQKQDVIENENENYLADVDSDNVHVQVGQAAGIAFARALQRVPALSRETLMGGRGVIDRGVIPRVETFVRDRISPLLIAAEVRRVREWGSFGGGNGGNNTNKTTGGVGSSSSASTTLPQDLDDEDGEVEAHGSVAGRECWASYKFSDVTMEIGVRLPEAFPLRTAVVEARSRVGMSEARWRKTVLRMNTILQVRDGCVAEAVDLWRRNLDATFKGKEECPICYSVLHPATAALPKMQCRTCKKRFHPDCLCKWFTKSNTSACPLCRSAF